MGKALPSEETTVQCVQHVATQLSHKRWSAMDAVPSNGYCDLWRTASAERANYVIASRLPTGRLPQKVCELVVFYIPLLLSCTKPAFNKKSHRHVADPRPARSILTYWDRSIRSETCPPLFWSLTCRRHFCNMLKTCRKPGQKPGFKQVLSKIDLIGFGQ